MNFLKNNWFKLIAIAILLIALGNQPYSYYQFLRWVILVVGIYSAYLAYRLENKFWLWLFGAIAILFNPIIPFYFQRNTWQFIDIITAIIFLIFIFNKPKTKDSL